MRLGIYGISLLTTILAHNTICLSTFDTRVFRWVPGIRKRLVQIQLATEAPTLPLSKEEARAKLLGTLPRPPQDSLWVGSIAELHSNKNIRLGLDAVSEASKKPLSLFYTIIGDGEEREKLIQHAQAVGLTGHVLFTGEISKASEFLSAFDILLIPSNKEGMPYVLLEAAHASLPVVATRVGGITETIEHGKNGMLAAPRSVKELSDAIITLGADTSLRETLGRALHDTLAIRTVNTMSEETTRLYETT